MSLGFGRRASALDRSSMPRPSINQSSRRSSLFHQRKAKDPRDFKNKKQRDKNINILFQYLLAHNYNEPLPKDVKKNGPSISFVRNAFLFLMNEINPKYGQYQDTRAIPEEVKTFYENLGYPFPISKSDIQICAAHVWPKQLAMMVWVIELLNYWECCENEPQSFDEDLDDGAGQYEFYAEQYQRFMEGGNPDAELKDDLQSKRAKQAQEMESKKNRILTDLSTMRREQQRMLEMHEPIEDLRARAMKIRADRQERAHYVDKFEENSRLCEASVDKLKARRDEVNENLEKFSLQKDCLQEEFNNQELSPEDVADMNKERTKLELDMKQCDSRLKESSELAFELENRVEELAAEMHEAAERFNDTCVKAQLAPPGAALASETDFRLKVVTSDYLYEPHQNMQRVAHAMVTVDLKYVVKPHIRAQMDMLMASLEKKKREHRNDDIALLELKSELERLNRAVEDGTNNMLRVKKTYAEAKDAFDKELRANRDELQKIKQEQRRVEMEVSTVPERNKQLEEKKRRYADMVEKHAHKCKRFNDEAMLAVQTAMQHYAWIEEQFTRLRDEHKRFAVKVGAAGRHAEETILRSGPLSG